MKIPISKYLIRNDKGVVGVLRDSTMRGLISILEKSLPSYYVEDDEKCNGRLRRHAEAVFNVLTVLMTEQPDVDIVKGVVVGEYDFGFILKGEENPPRQASKENESEEQQPREIVIDAFKYAGDD